MPLDPRRVKELFIAASELPDPQARQAYLARECGADAELRQRLDVLLAAHDAPHAALNQPLVAEVPGATAAYESLKDAPPAESVGSVIAGKYKLLQEIGEGGMGSVFMADQTHPVKRRVAVKVIKAAWTRPACSLGSRRNGKRSPSWTTRTSLRCSTPARPTLAGRSS